MIPILTLIAGLCFGFVIGLFVGILGETGKAQDDWSGHDFL